MTQSSTRTPNYGLDAPGVVRTMALLALVLIGGGLLLRAFAISPGLQRLARSLLWPGVSFGVTAVLMVLSSRVGKLRARDRLLSRLDLRGDEQLLDVGCGHGLLLVGAAKRLPYGNAIGVDLWSQSDQYGNSPAATLANAAAEGVSDRVVVRDGDMRLLPFDDSSMDVAVSSLAIHNVPSASARAKAVHEIARVVRPGGRVALLDIANVGAYADELRALGWIIEHTGYTPWIFPPTRELVARRPD